MGAPLTGNRWLFALWAAYLLAGMHFFMHSPGGTGLYLPFNAVGWMFASAVIGLGATQVISHRVIRISSLQAWFAVGAILMTIPMLYPGFEFKEFAVPRLLGLFGGLAFLFALHQWRLAREDVFNLMYLVLAAVLVEAALGLVQYFVLASEKLPFGIFRQRNAMASFMATGLAVALWLWANDDRPSALKRALVLATVPVTSMLVVSLQSQTGWLGALLAVLVLLPSLAARRDGRVWTALVLIGLGCACGIATHAGSGRQPEATIRGVVWAQAWRMIVARPLAGYGYGGFERSFLGDYAATRDVDSRLPALIEDVDHPHNEFLFWGVEGGILPMIGMAMMAVAFIALLLRAPWRSALGYFGLVAPIMAHTQTEYPFYLSVAHGLVLLLIVDFVDREVGKSREVPYERRFLPAVVSFSIPAVVIAFMLTALQTAWVVTKFERGGSSDPFLLIGASNPSAWLSRYEFNAYTVRLRIGMKSGNNAELEDYVAWGKRFVERTPRSSVYVNMSIALERLGRPAEAASIRAEGARLFPRELALRNNAVGGVDTRM